MSERTRGEVISAVLSVSKQAESPYHVANWIRQDTLPYFKGDFDAVVNALATAGSGTTFQGANPSTWDHIQKIGQAHPRLGDALTAMAIEENVEPPVNTTLNAVRKFPGSPSIIYE